MASGIIPVEESTYGLKPAPPVKDVKDYVRALFDCDSNTDAECPSPGLSFKHGDILHVFDVDGEEWWQAALVDNHTEDGPKGFIPNKKRAEHRDQENQKSANSSPPDLIPAYEWVKLKPRGYERPVFIVGPLKDDVNDKLAQEFPDKFARCVPHTTREPLDGEVDGRDFHFVFSVEQMERAAHLFIEMGCFRQNLYGTSIQAVQDVANQGKHCVLCVALKRAAISALQMADLDPIALCIRPTSADVIQTAQPGYSAEMSKQIFDHSKRIEQEFEDFFTAIVEGDSLSDIYSKVKTAIQEHSGMWLPGRPKKKFPERGIWVATVSDSDEEDAVNISSQLNITDAPAPPVKQL